ncbi:MAG: cytochrome C [Deltaproteobacteria bacterium]|nr:cytochrome C [Deltaproteobacteria bacterium]
MRDPLKSEWRTVLMIVLLTVAGEIFIPPSLPAQRNNPELSGNYRCDFCHDFYRFRSQFPRSVHGPNGCGSCHREIGDLRLHMEGREKPITISCGSCHGEIEEDYRKSVHYVKQNITCQDCHRDIHVIEKSKGDFKRLVQDRCTTCHPARDYSMSGHGKAVADGNPDAATCSDCHGLHDTPVNDTESEQDMARVKEYYTQTCQRCHADPAMMKRNGLSVKAALLYSETYHGKVRDIGYPSRVAGCSDCHNGHNTLPPSDPRSTLNPSDLVRDCGKCHGRFHPRFVAFHPHPDYGDRKRYPVLFWTNVFMDALLLSVFLFFWGHAFLWWRKAYWSRALKAKAGDRIGQSECVETGQIERFSLAERIMHVLLIFSFFTLVMTGFPLKYHDRAWARVMIDLWGGADSAGLFHRMATLLLSTLFLYTIWLSLKFLFPRGQGTKGWVGRLLGPDSLCPNLKDWEDIKGMFRWFFNRGDMPRFDRWTYWEKFDFFAVFWGMFAIGLSGLMLWFPELFSYVFPGWVINMATVVHSEEAFLAAIFIFTVHFFNNHFVPNKFPLEPNIFTGRYPLSVLREERPLEYERLAVQGRLDELKREGPGVLTQLLTAFIGLASLLLGLFLTGLILWTAWFY